MKKINGAVLLSVLSFILIFFAGCDPSKKWEKEERSRIQEYLRTIGDTIYILKPSGLYYLEIQLGTGRMPVPKDTVEFWYTAKLFDGSMFSTNLADSLPYPFIVGSGEIISGIDEGVRYMKQGGISYFITPSNLAYGSVGIWGYLPGYTPIIWQVHLARVRPGSKK
jgi:FKBP-type peptidyl-prolyl cis-trans isomerase